MRSRATWRARLAGALAATALALGASPRASSAQTPTGNVSIVLPASALRGDTDTLRSPTPSFVIQASNFATTGPLRITLQVSNTNRFDGPLAVDTTIITTNPSAVIAPGRALAERSRNFYRAVVVDAVGATASSAVAGPVVAPAWVTLVTPPNVVGQPVRTRTPRFVWRSPPIVEPPGPWEYQITIVNLGRQEQIRSNVGSDTTFVPSEDLEANAFYTWSVTARLPRTAQSTVVNSPTNFVVEDAAVPVLTTSLSPPFPNPFPEAATSTNFTCIWFDLRAPSTVSLDVYTLRGNHVRRLAPNGEMTGPLPAGLYGRGRTELNEGCDQRFTWDGTDDSGRVVPEGVYLVRFKGDGSEFTRKVLFRGRP